MPIFVNTASSDPGSLGDSLKSLGESMFGNQALHEVQRQTARKLGNENTGAEQGAAAFRNNNKVELGANSYLAGRSAADAQGYNSLRAADFSNNNPSSPDVTTALTAEGRYPQTPVGQTQEQNAAMARQQSANQAALQRQQAEPIEGFDKDNNIVYSTKGGVTAPGSTVRPIPTAEQQLGMMLQPGQKPAAPSPAQPTGSVPYVDPNGQPTAQTPAAAPAQPQQQTQQEQAPPVIQAMLDGRMPPPPMRSPQSILMVNAAAKWAQDHGDPTGFDETKWASRNHQESDIATNGNAGKMLLAYNQLLPHLKTASDLAMALQNGDTRLVNSLTNEWRTQTGDPRPPTFETVREVASMDAARLLRGTGQMSEDDIEHWRQNLASSSSPQQLQSTLGTLGVDLMDARRDSIESQYKSIMGKDLQTAHPGIISPQALQARDVLASRKPNLTANVPGASKPQTVTQNGHTYTLGPDGNYH